MVKLTRKYGGDPVTINESLIVYFCQSIKGDGTDIYFSGAGPVAVEEDYETVHKIVGGAQHG